MGKGMLLCSNNGKSSDNEKVPELQGKRRACSLCENNMSQSWVGAETVSAKQMETIHDKS